MDDDEDDEMEMDGKNLNGKIQYGHIFNCLSGKSKFHFSGSDDEAEDEEGSEDEDDEGDESEDDDEVEEEEAEPPKKMQQKMKELKAKLQKNAQKTNVSCFIKN